jgi:hypothetical protein
VTYPRVGRKPAAMRGKVPEYLRLAISSRMCRLIATWTEWRTATDVPRIYINRFDANYLLAVIPRAGRTGLALRRRVKTLIRRWDSGA